MKTDRNGNLQPETVSELLYLIDTETTPRFIFVLVGEMNLSTAMTLSNTGIDLTGYTRMIDNSAIIHVRKKHGNSVTESARGQVAITDNDFEEIENIIEYPDSISYEGKDKSGNTDFLKFEKYISRTRYFLIMEIRNKRIRLSLKTMYKRSIKNYLDKLITK